MARVSQKYRVDEINRQLILMSSLVEKQIYESMNALKSSDRNLAEEVIKNDDKVDTLQKIIEEDCIKFIATEQPLAKDLRRVFTASKIVTDLERMADHAVDICKVAKNIKKDFFDSDIEPLWDMEEEVRKMISLGIEAYIEKDVDKAYEICKMDDKVDELYRSIFSNLVKKINLQDDKGKNKPQFLFVAKYLERIGDHVTNICEWTIFCKKGAYVDLNE